MKKYTLHHTQIFRAFFFCLLNHSCINFLQSVGGCVDALGGVVTSGVRDGEGDGLGVDRATVFVCVCV